MVRDLAVEELALTEDLGVAFGEAAIAPCGHEGLAWQML